MIRDINIKDFYLMATKRECSRYIIFLANQMSSTFRSLRFAPARGAAGVIFFQPIDILQKPTPEQQAERQSLCLFLAYFFVRIFQIYGALAITLIDDANVFVRFRDTKGLTEEQKARPFRGSEPIYGTPGAPNPLPGVFDYFRGEADEREPGIYPYKPTTNPVWRPPSEARYPVERDRRSDYDRRGDPYGRDRDRDRYRDPYDRVGYRGGAGTLEDSQLGRFQLFHQLLDGEEKKDARLTDTMDLRKNIGYPFKSSSLNASFKLQKDDFRGDTTSSSKGSLFIQITADRRLTRFYEVKLEVVNRINTPKLRIISVHYKSLLDDAIEAQRISRYGNPKSDSRADLEGPRFRQTLIDLYGADSYGEIPIISSGLNEYKIQTKSGQEDPLNFIKSLKENIDVMLGFRKASDYRDLTSRDNRVVGEVNQYLDIQNVLIYLQQKKPIAHCVARGLQLLGNRDPAKGFMESGVCQAKPFLISKKDYEESTTDRGDVPDPGGKFMSSGGLQALSNLFYDTIRFKSSNLIRSHKAMNDYIRFMKTMSNILLPGDSSGKPSAVTQSYMEIEKKSEKDKEILLENPNTPKLESLTDERMKKMCDILRQNEDKQYDPRTQSGRNILKQVSRLFGRQIQHAADCGYVLRQLFTTVSINGIVSVRINKVVYMKGVLELNRINDLARNLLIRYYESCEILYGEGVMMLVKAKENALLQQPKMYQQPQPQQQQEPQEPQEPQQRRGGATRKRKVQ